MAVDRRGDILLVDPADPVLDLPVLRVMTPGADAFWGMRVLARDAARIAEAAPEVFAVISEAHIGDHEVTLFLGDSEVRVRYQPPITEMRLREAIVALNDAVARLDAPPREIDARFADQIVVRTR
jgi:ABC-type iron transport system FetAB permease component